MVKDFFDIEPIQKNALIIFLSIVCICFLQLFLFKREIFQNDTFQIVGLTLSLSVCWSLLSLTSAVFFRFYQLSLNQLKGEKPGENKKVVMLDGILMISWILLLTYLAYELKLNYETLVRFAILINAIKSLFWFAKARKVINNIKFREYANSMKPVQNP